MDFGRRDFLTLGAGALLATELPLTAEAKRDPIAPLKVENFEIKVGASKPFGAIQVSDTHIVRVDKRDDERKMMLAAGRSFTPFANIIWTRRSTSRRRTATCCSTRAISSTS